MKWKTCGFFLSPHRLCSTYRSTCPECSTPNPQPARLRGQTFTSPTAPRRAAQSTAPPWSRTADSGRFHYGSMCSWKVASPNCWLETEAALSRENLQMLKRTKVCKGPNARAPPAKFQEEEKEERNLLFCLSYYMILYILLGNFLCLWRVFDNSTVKILHFRVCSFKPSIIHLRESKCHFTHLEIAEPIILVAFMCWFHEKVRRFFFSNFQL